MIWILEQDQGREARSVLLARAHLGETDSKEGQILAELLLLDTTGGRDTGSLG